MPPSKRKSKKSQNIAKKSRQGVKKKNSDADRTWKSSYKVKVGDSRSSTPASADHSEGLSQRNPTNSSMTSRDFIRKVMEFEKAADSESSEYYDSDASENDVNKAIQNSLDDELVDDPDTKDDSFLLDMEEDSVMSVGSSALRFNTDNDSLCEDSNASFPAAKTEDSEDSLHPVSVYAPMPETTEDIPELKVPFSADDLPLPRENLLIAIGVYETIMAYKQIIRLSPFVFEDFAAALSSGEYNILLHEIHSCLIKTLLREEDNNQTQFGPVDLKDSMNSMLFFNDAMTYPALIKAYLNSDSDKEFSLALNEASQPDYPLKPIQDTLTVLQAMCNLLITSNSVREELTSDGFIKYDDHCRVCQKTGDVLCCDTCPAVYHMYCVDPPMEELPEGDWNCVVCVDSEVRGVSECVQPRVGRAMHRQDPLGFDRHRRKYWFMIRRVIIESEDGEVWYVSTPSQLDEIISSLDGDGWERHLVANIENHKQEILYQMDITRQLTNEYKGTRRSMLDEDDERLKQMREDRVKQAETALEGNNLNPKASLDEKKAVETSSDEGKTKTSLETEKPEAQIACLPTDKTAPNAADPAAGDSESASNTPEEETSQDDKVTDNKEASAGACVETERGEQQSIVQEVVVAEDEEEPGEDEVLLEGKGDELIADDGEEPIDEKLEELIEEDREELIEGEEITIDADGNEDSMEEYADDLASSDPFGGDTSPLPPEDSDEYDPEADEDDGELLEEEIDFVRVPASDDEETLDIRSQLDGAADSEDESEASKPKTSPIVIGSMVNKPIKTYSATPRQHILTSGGGKTIQIISSQPTGPGANGDNASVNDGQVLSSPASGSGNAVTVTATPTAVQKGIRLIQSGTPNTPQRIQILSTQGGQLKVLQTTDTMAKLNAGQIKVISQATGQPMKIISAGGQVTGMPLKTIGNQPIRIISSSPQAGSIRPAATIVRSATPVISTAGQTIRPTIGTTLRAATPTVTIRPAAPKPTTIPNASGITLLPTNVDTNKLTVINPQLISTPAKAGSLLTRRVIGDKTPVKISSANTLQQMVCGAGSTKGLTLVTQTGTAPKPINIVSQSAGSKAIQLITQSNASVVGNQLNNRQMGQIITITSGESGATSTIIGTTTAVCRPLLTISSAVNKNPVPNPQILTINATGGPSLNTQQIVTVNAQGQKVDTLSTGGGKIVTPSIPNIIGRKPTVSLPGAIVSSPSVARNVAYTKSMILPKGNLPPQQGSQTVILVNKDGTRSQIQIPASAIGKNGKITIPASALQGLASNKAASSGVDSKNYVTRAKTGNLAPKKFTDSVTDIKGGLKMISNYKAQQEKLQKDQKKKLADELKVDDGILARAPTPEPPKPPPKPMGPFRLGTEGGFKHYVNQYTENPLALSKSQSQEDKDKKRYLSYKFSLTTASEFSWTGPVYGPVGTIMETLRSSMLHFEEQIPSCFMHGNWDQYRLLWVKAAQACSKVSDFSTVLNVLQNNIKPCVFTACWAESLGHLTLRRLTASEKDEIKKKEKIDKRKQELEEQQQASNSYTMIKYTKGLKHQIHKLKGEEYRISDLTGQGWQWLDATRFYRHVPQDRVGLRNCARKLREARIADPAIEDYSTKTQDLVDVSRSLDNRDMYPVVQKPNSKLDTLLAWRLKLEQLEKKNTPSGFNEEGTVPYNCYSPMCGRSTIYSCYSSLCRNCKTAQKTEPDAPEEMDVDVCASSPQKRPAAASLAGARMTQQPVSLGMFLAKAKETVSLRSKKAPAKRPKLIINNKFKTRHGRLSPFVLSPWELPIMARKGGMYEAAYFNYTCKNAPGYWPYPCPRPRFKLGWEYRLSTDCTSIHGVASHLRVLWACIRWDDLATKPPAGGTNTTSTETDITTREVLERRDVPPNNLRSEFKIRTIVIPLDFMENPNRTETSEPIREGLRKRKKHQVKQVSKPTQTVAWWPEERLELWEIQTFYEKHEAHKLNKVNTAKEKEKKIMPKPKSQPASSHNPPVPLDPGLSTLKLPQTQQELKSVKQQMEEQLKVQRAAAQAKRADDQNQGLLPTSIDASKLRGAVPINLPPTQRLVIKGKDGKTTTINQLNPSQVLVRLTDGTMSIASRADIKAANQPITETPVSSVASHSVPESSSTANLDKAKADSLASLNPSSLQSQLQQAQNLASSADKMNSSAVDLPISSSTATADILPEEAVQSSKKDSTEVDNSLSRDTMQKVVAQALSNAKDNSEIQSKLVAMQKKLSTVQGTITLAKDSQQGPVGSDDEFSPSKHQKYKMKEMFQPATLTPEEQEQLRVKKLKNKEDYKRRKAKETIKRLTSLVQKHKEHLKQKIKEHKDHTKAKLRDELKKEIFTETGLTVPSPVHESEMPTAAALLAAQAGAFTTPSTSSVGKRPSTSKYAKRKSPGSLESATPAAKKIKRERTSPKKVKHTTITKPKQLQNKLYCICQTPYDPLQLYATCDLCSEQFHHSCIGVSADARSYVCATCSEIKTEKTAAAISEGQDVYCICKTPYDDTQFYVGCDDCEDWFHPACVGISAEVAESMDTYLCPTCKLSNHQSDVEIDILISTELKKLIKMLRIHIDAWPFLKPVKAKDVPDYYDVIKEPMDLTTLQNKLANGDFQTLQEFITCTTKIFNNARYYNSSESPIFACAENVEKLFVQKIKELRSQVG